MAVSIDVSGISAGIVGSLGNMQLPPIPDGTKIGKKMAEDKAKEKVKARVDVNNPTNTPIAPSTPSSGDDVFVTSTKDRIGSSARPEARGSANNLRPRSAGITRGAQPRGAFHEF